MRKYIWWKPQCPHLCHVKWLGNRNTWYNELKCSYPRLIRYWLNKLAGGKIHLMKTTMSTPAQYQLYGICPLPPWFKMFKCKVRYWWWERASYENHSVHTCLVSPVLPAGTVLCYVVLEKHSTSEKCRFGLINVMWFWKQHSTQHPQKNFRLCRMLCGFGAAQHLRKSLVL